MDGHYCVMQTTDERYDLALAGSVIAPILGLPLLDVRKSLVDASGILWDGLNQEAAESVAAALTAHGIGAIARDESTLRNPGARWEITRGQITDDGFLAQPKGGERLIAYAELILLTCAKVKGDPKEKKYRTDGHTVVRGGSRLTQGLGYPGPTYITIRERGDDSLILDLFARNPDEVYRLESGKFRFAMAGLRPAPSTYGGFRNLVEELVTRAPGAVTNCGVDVVLGKGGTWPDATYDSFEELDRHNLWMLQLVTE